MAATAIVTSAERALLCSEMNRAETAALTCVQHPDCSRAEMDRACLVLLQTRYETQR